MGWTDMQSAAIDAASMKSHQFSRRRCFALIIAGLVLPVFAEDERPVVDDRGVQRENAAKASLPTLWIAGDSTVKSNSPMRGWGQDLGIFFDPAKINVVTRAIGGRSSRTFFTEGRWKEIEDALKPGDFVLIQFGHNDVGPLDDKGKFRGSIKGTGDETEKVNKPDGSVEDVHSYGWYLKQMAAGARNKKAKVILCSPVPHMKFDRSGKFVQDWKDHRGWVEQCAKAERAAFLDLASIIGNQYAALPKATVKSYFADKGTHTNADGAMFSAKAVVAGLKSIPGGPLDSYLNEKSKEIPAARK